MIRKTKIIATIGPSTSSKEMIKLLIQKGVNVCRLNFSHLSYNEAKEIISNVKKANQELNVHTAILADLQGPKIRLGNFEKPIRLLFKVDEGNKLGIDRPVIVGDVNGKIFSFDLHSYMSLKKLANGSDAKVTAHLHKTQRGTDKGVLIFRDEKGNTTAVLASRSDSTKVVTEATKFKNEFSI